MNNNSGFGSNLFSNLSEEDKLKLLEMRESSSDGQFALEDFTSHINPQKPLMPVDVEPQAETQRQVASKSEPVSSFKPTKESLEASPTFQALPPAVQSNIKSKYGLLDGEEYDKQLKAAQEDADSRRSGLGWAQFAAGIGDAFAGRDPSNTARNFQQIRQDIQNNTVGNLENRRKAQMENLSSNSAMDKMQRDNDLFDPKSGQSMAFRKIIEAQFPSVVKAYGENWDNVSAGDKENIFQPLKLKEEIDARRQNTQMMAEARKDQRDLIQEERQKTRDDKKKTTLNEIEDRRTNILDNIKSLDEMIDEDGTYEFFGSHNADLNRKVDMIATDMAKLADPDSVARPSEVEMFKKGLIQANKASMKNSTARDILKNFKGEVEKRADNAYVIRGMENPKAKRQPSANPEAPQKDSKPKTITQNGHTYTLNEQTGEYE